MRRENPDAAGQIPLDLVTASASGLDPHISPEAARRQAPRVAAVRRLSVSELMPLVEARIEERTLGLLGEPRVNVLLLNRDLDARLGPPELPRWGSRSALW